MSQNLRAQAYCNRELPTRLGDMIYETLTFDTDADGIGTLTLNRPDALNAFSVTMARELLDFFSGDATDDAVKAIVVTGAGRAFCAGMDLSAEGNVFGLDETLRPTPETVRAHLADPATHPEYADGLRDTGGKVALAIHALPKPVIAAINGPAVGIGATMTCAMDLRLASTKARIGFVFGRLGIVPEACSSWFLPRIVGVSQALEWIYSAEVLSADEARDGGLVRSVHAPEELLTAAYELARKFVVGRSPVALGLAKQLVLGNAGAPHPRDAHAADSLAMFYTSVGDGKEGVAAFLEKREPKFTGRASQLPRVFPG
ncbi:crotonase/enoyl-CoA hydratase family protein [Streptomyces sp. NPDC051684]|uniref:crotonase/enoyl-CoA hydratase family protein n=1 Tax=Streptomyces sp. NPDC051684 TaxID=3365670 RepID=UPI0037A85AB3